MGKLAARLGIDTAGHVGPIITGSSDVIIGGKPAARKGDGFTCSIHGAGTISEGSKTVFINGKAAARMGDVTDCGAPPSPAIGAPPVNNFATAAKNVDEKGNVVSPNLTDKNGETKAFFAGYELSDSNKNGDYDTIKGQVSVLDMDLHTDKDAMAGAGMKMKVLHAEGKARGGFDNGYYGFETTAEAKVAGGKVEGHLGKADSRIAYAEAKGDLFYAEHEATAEGYWGGEGKDNKYGFKLRTTEQAGVVKGKVSAGTDALSGKSESKKTESDGTETNSKKKIATEVGAGGSAGAVGWDLGVEAYYDHDKYAIKAKIDMGAAVIFGLNVNASIDISFKPVVDLWDWLFGTSKAGIVISGCSTVLIGD